MNFEEWKAWKEKQPLGSTCDYIGCTRPPAWRLVKNNIYFCIKHGSQINMKHNYGEEPVYLSTNIAMNEKEIIGTRKCWVCESELPLTLVPDDCELSCVDGIYEYGTCAENDGEKAWLCPIHLILWHDRQKIACLERVKQN